MDTILASGGAFEALEQLQSQGEIHGFGLGNRSHRYQRRVIDSGRASVILPSYDYHPIRQSLAPLLDIAGSADVAVVNGSPYQAGLLAGIDLDEAARRRSPDDADLLRARAIENQAFVLAPAQCGRHSENRASYGRSLIVDPWGLILAQAGDRPGVITAVCDLRELERSREQLPALKHRKLT
jgi:predicted amidohydrolase